MMEEPARDATTSQALYQLALGQVFARVDQSAAQGLSTAQLLRALDLSIREALRTIPELSEEDRIQVLALRRDLGRAVAQSRARFGLPPLPPDA